MHQVFLVAIPVALATSGSSVAFLEMIFIDGIPYAVFDWLTAEARKPRTMVKLDPTFLSPADGKSDYVYKAVIRDPRIVYGG